MPASQSWQLFAILVTTLTNAPHATVRSCIGERANGFARTTMNDALRRCSQFSPGSCSTRCGSMWCTLGNVRASVRVWCVCVCVCTCVHMRAVVWHVCVCVRRACVRTFVRVQVVASRRSECERDEEQARRSTSGRARACACALVWGMRHAWRACVCAAFTRVGTSGSSASPPPVMASELPSNSGLVLSLSTPCVYIEITNGTFVRACVCVRARTRTRARARAHTSAVAPAGRACKPADRFGHVPFEWAACTMRERCDAGRCCCMHIHVRSSLEGCIWWSQSPWSPRAESPRRAACRVLPRSCCPRPRSPGSANKKR